MIEQYVSPVEFRRLVSALLAVLGFIAIAMLFAFLVIPGTRYRAHTTRDSAVAQVQGESGWLDPTEYLATRKYEIPPVDPKTVMTPTPELLARGKTLFGQSCASCHGPTGHGDGPGGKGLNPPPRNFSSEAGWKNGTGVESIFRTLEDGLKGSAMVSYSHLRRIDRMALVHYVQSLGRFQHDPSDPAARAALEKQFATTGEVIPNKIPVSEAIRALVEEYRTHEAPALCPRIPEGQAAVADPERAARTLEALRERPHAAVALAQPIGFGAPENGFAPKANTFSPAEWNQLKLCIASP